MSSKNKNIKLEQIDLNFMIELKTFTDSDITLSLCKDKIIDEIFKGEFKIGLENVKDKSKFLQTKILNSNFFKDEFKKFCCKALDLITLFGFFGYYYVRDIDRWLEDEEGNFEKAKKKGDFYKFNIPFNIIPLGYSDIDTWGTFYKETHLLKLTERLIFKPINKNLNRYYKFKVFNYSASFVPIFVNGLVTSNVCNSGIAYDIKYNPQQQYYTQGGTAGGSLIPISPFIQLYKQRSLIDEAIDCEFQANYNLSDPTTFLTVKQLPETPIEKIADDDIYTTDSILGAKTIDSIRNQNYVMQAAEFMIKKLTSRGKETESLIHGYEDTIRFKRQMKYKRSTMIESIHALPENMEINKFIEPKIILSSDDLQIKYKNLICSIMKIPYIFIDPNINLSSSKKGSNKSNNSSSSSINSSSFSQTSSFYQEEFDQEIYKKRSLINTIFRDIYHNTFRKLDKHIFDSIKNDKDIDENLKLFNEDDLNIIVKFEKIYKKDEKQLEKLIPLYNMGLINEDAFKDIINDHFNSNNVEKKKITTTVTKLPFHITQMNKQKEKDSQLSKKLINNNSKETTKPKEEEEEGEEEGKKEKKKEKETNEEEESETKKRKSNKDEKKEKQMKKQKTS